MNERKFYSGLLFLVGLTILGICLLHQWNEISEYHELSWVALFFFAVLSIGLYYISRKAALHENPLMFVYVMYGSILLKFIFAIGIVWYYHEQFQPTSRYFVVPTLIIYAGFTIYETFFMTKLGKTNPKDEIKKEI